MTIISLYSPDLWGRDLRPHGPGADKDAAQALGYGEGKSLANAVANHIDEKDKGVTEWMTPGGKQSVPIINESGLLRREGASEILTPLAGA